MKPVLVLLMIIGSTLLAAAQVNLRAKEFNLDQRLALSGYDPVSYFVQHKPTKGKKEITTTMEDVIYYFSSTTNKETFLADPKKYEPQYGGWCAYAMGSTGEKVDVDPETFKIMSGKLYLFYNSYFNNTLTKWNKDEGNLQIKADKNWSSIYKEPKL